MRLGELEKIIEADPEAMPLDPQWIEADPETEPAAAPQKEQELEPVQK